MVVDFEIELEENRQQGCHVAKLTLMGKIMAGKPLNRKGIWNILEHMGCEERCRDQGNGSEFDDNYITNRKVMETATVICWI